MNLTGLKWTKNVNLEKLEVFQDNWHSKAGLLGFQTHVQNLFKFD